MEETEYYRFKVIKNDEILLIKDQLKTLVK